METGLLNTALRTRQTSINSLNKSSYPGPAGNPGSFLYMTTSDTPLWDRLVREVGADAAGDILNELIARKLDEAHPDFYELDEFDRFVLEAEFWQRYTGADAEPLLAEYFAN